MRPELGDAYALDAEGKPERVDVLVVVDPEGEAKNERGDRKGRDQKRIALGFEGRGFQGVAEPEPLPTTGVVVTQSSSVGMMMPEPEPEPPPASGVVVPASPLVSQASTPQSSPA